MSAAETNGQIQALTGQRDLAQKREVLLTGKLHAQAEQIDAQAAEITRLREQLKRLRARKGLPPEGEA